MDFDPHPLHHFLPRRLSARRRNQKRYALTDSEQSPCRASGHGACSTFWVDDFTQIEARKRYLLERAAKLMGRDQLAQRLGIPSTLFEDWIRGDATMPDGKLMELARVLDTMSREQNNQVEKKGSDG